MHQYHDLINLILTSGKPRNDRTGTGTIGLFGHQMRFNLQEGFPLMTTKKLHFKSIAIELLWFLKGDTNIHFLKENNVRIWNEWATEDGEIGPLYGKQWTAWKTASGETINQIEQVVHQIKTNPKSRRLIVSAWNPSDLPDETISPQDNVKNGRMALAACHALFQFYVEDMSVHERINAYCQKNTVEKWNELMSLYQLPFWHDEESEEYKLNWKQKATQILDDVNQPKQALSCQLYQRSADVFLGVPFNIASYALLTHMIAHQCDMDVGDFVWTGGDVHLYNNTLDQARLQLTRPPLRLPTIAFARKPESIFDYQFEDIILQNYQAYDHIKAAVSV